MRSLETIATEWTVAELNARYREWPYRAQLWSQLSEKLSREWADAVWEDFCDNCLGLNHPLDGGPQAVSSSVRYFSEGVKR